MSRRLAATFRRAARRGAAETAPALRLTLPDLLRLHGQASAAVLLMLSAVLSAIPIAGLGSVLAFLILALAWRWHRGGDPPALPGRMQQLALDANWSRRLLHLLAWIYASAGRFMRARWCWLQHRRLHVCWGVWIATMGFLILLPLPLGNVLPSLSLVLLSLGWMFRDGLALLASGVVGTGALGWSVLVGLALVQGTGAAAGWVQRLL